MNPIQALTPTRPSHVRAPDRTTTTVAVLGLGYVGLPTALAFANAGLDVLGVDVSPKRLTDIAAGEVDLLPGDLTRLSVYRDRELRCGADPSALAQADAVVVCVPTPIDAEHVPDLRALRAACATAVQHARTGQLLVLTSTSYVGSTAELLVEPLTAAGFTVGEDVHVAFAPERIDPGNTTHPQESVPRVVGGVTDACADRAAEVLGRVASVHRVSSPEAAELVKLHENTFRAVNIAYAYEIARAAGSYGLDVREVIEAAASKPFGFMPFHPSAGVGGHCIPCDPHYLLKPLADRGVTSPIVQSAMDAIAARPGEVVRRIAELTSRAGGGSPRVLVVGACYKPGVADVRESPALEVLRGLLALPMDVEYHDPLVPVLDLDGTPMVHVPAPEVDAYDLVVLICVHPGAEPFWLDGTVPILDCTYRNVPSADRRRRTL
jgi:UDP-N-acetyl-D-glucosamine dehydrogenase